MTKFRQLALKIYSFRRPAASTNASANFLLNVTFNGWCYSLNRSSLVPKFLEPARTRDCSPRVARLSREKQPRWNLHTFAVSHFGNGNLPRASCIVGRLMEKRYGRYSRVISSSWNPIAFSVAAQYFKTPFFRVYRVRFVNRNSLSSCFFKDDFSVSRNDQVSTRNRAIC